MASEISWRHDATGSDLYVTIRNSSRQMWNGSGVETLTVANWGDYDIGMLESPASSYFYVADWPTGLTTAGWYWVDIYDGASPAISDTLVATIVGYWNGTTFDPWDANTVQVAGTTQTAGDLASDLGSILEDTATTLPAAIAAMADNVTVLYDDWLDGGRLDTILDSLSGGGATNLSTETTIITTD